jgi:tRNA (guanine9-N1)-methyltransferase
MTSSNDKQEMKGISSPPSTLFPKEVEGLSKNRQKQIAKRQRAKQKKAERKLKEKELRYTKALAQGRDLQAEEDYRIQRTLVGENKRKRRLEWETTKLPILESNFSICLDCSFEKLMSEREISSLASQVRYCYSYNKKAAIPCHFTLTSLGGLLSGLLENETGFEEWPNRGFGHSDQHWKEYYSCEDNKNNPRHQELVYLTSDSDNTIETLESTKIYVIGGLVDRNRCKGLSLESAQKHGIFHAKLPLDTYLKQMPSTKVLTCNHVFDILLKCRENKGDWTKALQQVLPSRKDATYNKTL